MQTEFNYLLECCTQWLLIYTALLLAVAVVVVVVLVVVAVADKQHAHKKQCGFFPLRVARARVCHSVL